MQQINYKSAIKISNSVYKISLNMPIKVRYIFVSHFYQSSNKHFVETLEYDEVQSVICLLPDMIDPRKNTRKIIFFGKNPLL